MRRTVSDPPLISSAENELVKRLRRLALGRESGEVLLEGPRVLSQALAAGIQLEVLAVREGDSFEGEAERRINLSRAIFRTLSQVQTPQGVLAIGRLPGSTLAAARRVARERRWPLVVLDGVQDPGNVGAIARTAAAAGAPSLIVLPGTADPFGPKSVRASAGHIFNLQVASAGWAELDDVNCLGAGTNGRPLEELEIGSVEAMVFGSEGHGLSRELPTVTVPMAPGIDSLNVAAAAAILIYEFRRRRAA